MHPVWCVISIIIINSNNSWSTGLYKYLHALVNTKPANQTKDRSSKWTYGVCRSGGMSTLFQMSARHNGAQSSPHACINLPHLLRELWNWAYTYYFPINLKRLITWLHVMIIKSDSIPVDIKVVAECYQARPLFKDKTMIDAEPLFKSALISKGFTIRMWRWLSTEF